VDQHLVDHYLGKKWRDQCEKLQEERARQRLAQQAAEAHDRGDEPGEIERPGGTDQPLARGHQDQLARPPFLEGGALLDCRSIGGEVLQQDAVGRGAGQQGEGTVLHKGDGRQGGLFQTRGWGAFAARLHVEAFGGAQDVIGREVLAVRRKFVPELGQIGWLAEKPKEADERQQSAIERHVGRGRPPKTHRCGFPPLSWSQICLGLRRRHLPNGAPFPNMIRLRLRARAIMSHLTVASPIRARRARPGRSDDVRSRPAFPSRRLAARRRCSEGKFSPSGENS
jgi:hypothetical protein